MTDNELIYKLAEENKMESNSPNWRKVSDDLFILNKSIKSSGACKKIYQRYVHRLNNINGDIKSKLLLSQQIESEVDLELSRHVVERFQDGTTSSSRLLAISLKQDKSDEWLLNAHGFDSALWEIVSTKSNMWQGLDKNSLIQTYSQSKITVRPLSYDRELSKKDIDDIVKNFKPKENNLVLLKHNRKDELALEIDLFDLHIGSLSWHEEVGKDNDYKIAFETIKRQVYQAREIIELYNVNKVYIVFGGDFLQCDNEEGATTKGTSVDMDSRSKKMVNKGLEIAMYVIDNLACADCEVIWIEGNHSRLVEYTLFHSLPYIYTNVKHIKFDVSPRLRKAFMYGKNLVGLAHGEMSKKNQFDWLQNEFREWWGIANYVEQHTGHFHSEITIEKAGIIQRQNPSTQVINAYEYGEGYISERCSISYLWTLNDKLKGTFYLR